MSANPYPAGSIAAREWHAGFGDTAPSPPPQAQGAALTSAGLLEAMARNYAGGHQWDHLDTEACLYAAALLRSAAETAAERDRLREALERLAQHVGPYVLAGTLLGDAYLSATAILAGTSESVELRRLRTVSAELLRALDRVCSHAIRSHAQITADWDNARATIASARAAGVQS